MTLDELDRKPARVWIDNRTSREAWYDSYAMVRGRCGGRPRRRPKPPRAQPLEPPPPEAELAVRSAFFPSAMLSVPELLEKLPTPLEWIDQLRERGVRVVETPSAEDAKHFARWKVFGVEGSR